jgi:hypothetical protein
MLPHLTHVCGTNSMSQLIKINGLIFLVLFVVKQGSDMGIEKIVLIL